MVEEYAMISFGYVGLLIAPEVMRRWRDSGSRFHGAEDGRACTIVL
jgi:hypothetical protein